MTTLLEQHPSAHSDASSRAAERDAPGHGREGHAEFEFLKTLANALAPLGQTSGELKGMLLDCAHGMGVRADFVVLSTIVQLTVRTSSGSQTAFITIAAPMVDLRRLDLLQRIAIDVRDGHITPDEGRTRIRRLQRRPPLRARWLIVLAGALQGFAYSLFLGGDMHEVAVAVPTGLLMGVFGLWARRQDRLRNVLELTGTFLAMCIGLSFSYVFKQFDPFVVALAASAQFMPGLRLTMAVAEISAGDLVSGVSRLAGAVLTLVFMAIGMLMGIGLFMYLKVGPELHSTDGSGWELIAGAVVVAALSYWILENARWRDLAWMALAVVLASAASRLGSHYLGSSFGAGIASLLVGISGNAYSRYMRRPKATMVVPGLMILVPGMLGVQGAFGALTELGTSQVSQLVNVALIAISVVVGLSIAESIVPPRALPQAWIDGDDDGDEPEWTTEAGDGGQAGSAAASEERGGGRRAWRPRRSAAPPVQ